MPVELASSGVIRAMNRRQLLVSVAAAIAAPALAAGGELSRRYPIAARLPIDLGLSRRFLFLPGPEPRAKRRAWFRMRLVEVDSMGNVTIEWRECEPSAQEVERSFDLPSPWDAIGEVGGSGFFYSIAVPLDGPAFWASLS